ncbi:MAG: lipoyl domain-containing protein [Pseudomonadota bacterium]
MAVELKIPKLGMSMEEALLQEWCVKDGEDVKEGDLIYLLETDKSVQEVEAPAAGTLKISAETGETYDVGTVIGAIV